MSIGQKKPAESSGGLFIITKVSYKVERKCKNHKNKRDPFCRLRQLGIQRLGLAFGKESIRTAGYSSGEPGTLTGLHENDSRHSDAG